ncbi:MAG: nucleoid-associated protein, partial [Sandaracinaceae bacterium]
MELDLSTFRIRTVIIHDLPVARGGEGSEPVLSDAPSPCPDEARTFFENKISESLRRVGRSVRFLDEDAPVRRNVGHLLDAPRAKLLAPSQAMAKHLHEVQSGRNSPGLLCVARGTLETSQPVVVLMKVEREQGIQIEMTSEGGKKTFDLRHLHNLMLTDRTRVFKTALFFAHTGPEDGLLSDDQLRGGDIARFFIHRFLGCALCAEPEVLTERYLAAAEKFIRTNISSGEEKAKSHAALVVDLGSNRKTLDPKAFARDHLEASVRDDFLRLLAEADVPTNRFQKDTSRIDKKLQRSRVRFTYGVYVTKRTDVVVYEFSIEVIEV